MTPQPDHTQIQMLASKSEGPFAAALLQNMFGTSHSPGIGQVSPGSNYAGDFNRNVQSRLDLPGLGQLIQTSTALSLQTGPLLTSQNPFCSPLD